MKILHFNSQCYLGKFREFSCVLIATAINIWTLNVETAAKRVCDKPGLVLKFEASAFEIHHSFYSLPCKG